MDMKQKTQRLKGFRDFLSTEVKERQWLIEKIKNVFERFGYQPLETPSLEYESLLLGKYGQEADHLIYKFRDKGNRKVALRYDQTVPMARVIAQYQNKLIYPYKRYQIQLVWRADKPQKGRFREFLQCDADIIGSTSSLADAEILALYFAIYKEIGLDSIIIKINDRKRLIKKIKDFGVKSDLILSVVQTLDKLDKKPPEEVLSELENKGLSLSIGKKLLNELKDDPLPENLKDIINLAVKLGVYKDSFQYEPTLARGLDYYTGMIFEGVIPEYKIGSVGGGGRYDNLIKDLVGIDIPGLGFGLGFDRTLEAVKFLGKMPQFFSSAQVLVTIFSRDFLFDSLEIAQKLRDQNISVECSLDLDKKLDKQLKYADKKGISWVVIIGPEEREKSLITLKNLKTRTQKQVKFKELITFLK